MGCLYRPVSVGTPSGARKAIKRKGAKLLLCGVAAPPKTENKKKHVHNNTLTRKKKTGEMENVFFFVS